MRPCFLGALAFVSGLSHLGAVSVDPRITADCEINSENICEACVDDVSLLQTTFQVLQQRRLEGSAEHSTYVASSPAIQYSWYFGLLFWLAFLIGAVAYECWLRNSAEATVCRDGRWDAVKFWCMMLVVWSHLIGFWGGYTSMKEWEQFPHSLVSHFHMPGFSFASGFFSAGIPNVDGNKVSCSFAKLNNSLRDLILVQLTLVPILVLSPLTWASTPAWSEATRAPLLQVPGTYWYLYALFWWQQVTPVLCTLRAPVLLAGAGVVIFRSTDEIFKGVFFYFIFFVAGFVLGGGGRKGEERTAARGRFEEWLVNSTTRVAACCLMAVWAACWNLKMAEPLKMIFNMNTLLNRDATPWSLGGWCTDVARIVFGMLGVVSFIVIIFMLPTCELISSTGSRTLYVYVLHSPMLIGNPSWNDVFWVVPEQWQPLAAFAIAFIFTLILGSRLMNAIMHHFVQPQWLVDLCIQKPQGGNGTTEWHTSPEK